MLLAAMPTTHIISAGFKLAKAVILHSVPWRILPLGAWLFLLADNFFTCTSRGKRGLEPRAIPAPKPIPGTLLHPFRVIGSCRSWLVRRRSFFFAPLCRNGWAYTGPTAGEGSYFLTGASNLGKGMLRWSHYAGCFPGKPAFTFDWQTYVWAGGFSG